MTTELVAPSEVEPLFDPRAIIAKHSKSFSLASRLLPSDTRDRAVALYAWCRHADDSIDHAAPREQPGRLDALRRELEAVYGGAMPSDPVARGLAEVVRTTGVPIEYPSALLDGLEMDVRGQRYATMLDLYRYSWCVAGSVGAMMCHVLGVDDPKARTPAAHLGLAMQLTNIARDVAEDWERGRLYLPEELVASHGGAELRRHLGGPIPEAYRDCVARAVLSLLEDAGRFYRSGLGGAAHLSPRAALSVRTAGLVYRAIGDRLRERAGDALAGRMVVPGWQKALLLLRATARTLFELPSRRPFAPTALRGAIRFPDDVLVPSSADALSP